MRAYVDRVHRRTCVRMWRGRVHRRTCVRMWRGRVHRRTCVRMWRGRVHRRTCVRIVVGVMVYSANTSDFIPVKTMVKQIHKQRKCGSAFRGWCVRW